MPDVAHSCTARREHSIRHTHSERSSAEFSYRCYQMPRQLAGREHARPQGHLAHFMESLGRIPH